MSQVVEHLAELTGFRDRDVLDVTLVGALNDLLQPTAVAIYRCVGEGDARRWLTRARLGPGDTTATADPLWTELENLPTLESQADRHACLLRQEALVVPGRPSMAYFPLSNDVQAIGVMEVATSELLGKEQLRLVNSILRIYHNMQGLLDYSERDTLTGLLNRKTFDESFMRIAAQPTPTPSAPPPDGGQMRRSNGAGSAWLAVIDIDHFKRVNDNYGHLIGDEVLLLLSRLMRASFRFHDHLYRFGGEEFVVLMRCNDAGQALSALERLRSRVETYQFPQVGRISVSVGFTELRAADTPAAAFERADKAVYWVKQNGRNQVASHIELVHSGRLAEAARDSDVELF
jgi:diguanylate cyclase (GGDEF)-like protein